MSTAQPTDPKRQTRGVEVLDQVDYRLAVTDEDKEAIYRLRYQAYLKEGAIEPNSVGLTVDRYDEMSNTFVFGVYMDNQLASSIRISVASPAMPTSPSVDVFNEILGPEVARGKVIVDPTRFVADQALARRFPELPYITVRLGYVACGYFNADIGLATVRAEHRAFYRKVFLQQPLCEPRLFPGLLKPVGLMAADYQDIRDRVFARFPYMRSSQFERRMLFGRGEATTAPVSASSLQQIHGVMSKSADLPSIAPAA